VNDDGRIAGIKAANTSITALGIGMITGGDGETIAIARGAREDDAPRQVILSSSFIVTTLVAVSGTAGARGGIILGGENLSRAGRRNGL